MCNGRYCLSFRSCYRLRAVPLFGGVCRAIQERSLIRPPSPPPFTLGGDPRGAPTSFYYFTVYFFWFARGTSPKRRECSWSNSLAGFCVVLVTGLDFFSLQRILPWIRKSPEWELPPITWSASWQQAWLWSRVGNRSLLASITILDRTSRLLWEWVW